MTVPNLSLASCGAVAVITMLAVVSPGPDFAMVTRNSCMFGRLAGLMTALGIACGVQFHAAYVMLGAAVLLVKAPGILLAIKMAGASYLVYIGVKTFWSETKIPLGAFDHERRPSSVRALMNGFYSNALNPKTMLFVMSTFTQVLTPSTPRIVEFACGLFMSAAHWIWFSIVAIFLTRSDLRRILLSKQKMLERVVGLVLISLGLGLAGSNLF